MRDRRVGLETTDGKYMNGLCFFAYRPENAPSNPGLGKPSAYVFQLFLAASSVSARLRPEAVQCVQSLETPCVEPETSAR